MPTLSVARREQFEEVYRQSHALWGAGLTVTDYKGMWDDLQATTWGRRYFRFLVWHDEQGRVLSSLKLYRPRVRVFGREHRACAIGAVFTPSSHRRKGHAAAMLARVIEEARDTGDSPALLFSDIGTPYYEALGFQSLPAEEAVGTLSRGGARPPEGWSLRPMRADDLDRVVAVHDAWCAKRTLAVIRDRSHWEFLIERARSYFARFDGSPLDRRYRIATRDGRFAGYVISVEGDGDWELREAGAEEGDPEALACILRTAAADARAAGCRRVYGWLPREWAPLVPEWKLRFEPRLRAIPMILRLDGGNAERFSHPEDAFFPYLDQF